MLTSLTIIILCQLLGETIVLLSGMPIPGAVVGMAILFFWLVIKKGISASLEKVSGVLHRYLALLFVPAGVGIINNTDFLLQWWAPFTASIVAGTVITIAITAVVMQKINAISKEQ